MQMSSGLNRWAKTWMRNMNLELSKLKFELHFYFDLMIKGKDYLDKNRRKVFSHYKFF
jgi:hypothetical protein